MFPKPKDERRRRPDVVKGIQYRFSKSMNVMQEFCVTPEATERRRREIYERDDRRCIECHGRVDFYLPPAAQWSMHWHHRLHRSLGGDDSLDNGETLCRDCHEQEHRPSQSQNRRDT